MARGQQHVVVIGDDHANPADDVKVLDISESVTTTVETSAFVTASADSSMSDHNIEVGCASPSNSVAESHSEYFSTRIEKMIQDKTEFATALEFEIEASRDHWSELIPLNVEVGDEVGEAGGAGKTAETNMEVFQRLQKKYGRFFQSERTLGIIWNGKIAEGAQADIFSISAGTGARHLPTALALKVFKQGSSLRNLEKQWPLGMLQNEGLKNYGLHHLFYTCCILGAILLNDGRFAFLMLQCWGDLRKLIDLKKQKNHNQGPPFTSAVTTRIMLEIAVGMRKLHKLDIVHSDLKASNVLIETGLATAMEEDDFTCQVADFECSVGVVGSRFWRAPEILRAVKSRHIEPELFTKSADVYSYGMTCYEIVTGRTPFEDLRATDFDVVIRGERPKLPSDIQPWMRDLITGCWHPNPLERPTFDTIADMLRERCPRWFEIPQHRCLEHLNA